MASHISHQTRPRSRHLTVAAIACTAATLLAACNEPVTSPSATRTSARAVSSIGTVPKAGESHDAVAPADSGGDTGTDTVDGGYITPHE